jgi:acetyl-CoA C-acetyltransferase
MGEAWIVDACRTPRGIGKPGKGALSGMHPQHLAATVLRAIAERNALNTADVDDVIWATSAQQGDQGCDLGRMAALDAGYDVRSSGVTLDRFCGSGITSVCLAAASIMSGMEELVVAGGTEKMSGFGGPGNPVPALIDAGNRRLRAAHPQPHQGLCADAIATLEGIGRTELDTFAVRSQQRAARAIADGLFARSMIPVHRPDGTLALDRDEFPRPDTTLESLSALRPSFAALSEAVLDAEGTTYSSLLRARYPPLEVAHVHHAGNSSGVVDGAAAVLLASPTYARAHNLVPRARVVAWANMGDSPTLMLNAPVPATRKVLERASLSLDDIDLFEVNEAFAVVVVRYMRLLGLDDSRVNVNGGSIALGHPIGATGSIMIGTLLDEMERRGARRGLATMCAGGGMAPAIVIERM